MITVFKKPDIQTLNSLGMTCVDMHYHTTHSDGLAEINDVAEKAKKLGIGIAITDHNKISGALEAQKIPGLFFIPGIEVDSIEGPDLLFYFYTVDELQRFYINEMDGCKKRDKSGNPIIHFNEILEKSRNYKCVVAMPHSCGFWWKNSRNYIERTNSQQFLNDIDAIETLNGEQTKQTNIKAVLWNRKLRKAIVGGSDGHCLFELGKTVTCTQAKTPEEFLDSLCARRTFVIGRDMNVFSYVLPGTISFFKNLNFALIVFLFKKKGW